MLNPSLIAVVGFLKRKRNPTIWFYRVNGKIWAGGGAPHLMLGGAVVERNMQNLPLGDWEVKNITSEERNMLSSNISKNFVQGILGVFTSPLWQPCRSTFH